MPIKVNRHSKSHTHRADGGQQPEDRHPGLSKAVFAADILHWTSQQDAHLAAGHTVSPAAAGSVGLHSANDGLRAMGDMYETAKDSVGSTLDDALKSLTRHRRF